MNEATSIHAKIIVNVNPHVGDVFLTMKTDMMIPRILTARNVDDNGANFTFLAIYREEN